MKVLLLKSDDRSNSSDLSNDCHFVLPYAITNVESVELLSFNTLNAYHNVHANYQNHQVWINGSNAITVSNGIYTLTELLNDLETQISTLIAPDSVTISLTSDFHVQITSTTNITLDSTAINSVLKELGFNNGITTSTSFLSAFPVEFNSNNSIFISVSQLYNTLHSSNNDDRKDACFLVYNDVNSGSLLSWNKNDKYEQFIPLATNTTFKNLRVRLSRKNGNLLENAAEWTMLLRFK